MVLGGYDGAGPFRHPDDGVNVERLRRERLARAQAPGVRVNVLALNLALDGLR